VTRAAKLFRSIYDETERMDGWVSLEVSPRLAYDTKGTIQQPLTCTAARRRTTSSRSPDPEGLPAIEESIFARRAINVTLLMSTDRRWWPPTPI